MTAHAPLISTQDDLFHEEVSLLLRKRSISPILADGVYGALTEDLDLAAGAIKENEQHRVEHLHLDVQLDQGGQTVDGFTEVDGLGIEVDLLHFGVGTHHDSELQ